MEKGIIMVMNGMDTNDTMGNLIVVMVVAMKKLLKRAPKTVVSREQTILVQRIVQFAADQAFVSMKPNPVLHAHPPPLVGANSISLADLWF